MSARGFGSLLSAGAVVGAALGFYLVSLRVASERAALEEVETRIAMTQRDIRLLQTEIGTRGRLAQLERWNVKFIRLSAPNADQFVEGGFQLASLVAPRKTPALDAPVVLAAAPIAPSGEQQKLEPESAAPPQSRPGSEMMRARAKHASEARAAVAKRGQRVCREVAFGIGGRDWVRGEVADVEGEHVGVLIQESGRAAIYPRGDVVGDAAQSWTPGW